MRTSPAPLQDSLCDQQPLGRRDSGCVEYISVTDLGCLERVWAKRLAEPRNPLRGSANFDSCPEHRKQNSRFSGTIKNKTSL
jgi:hypothetical protein